MTDFFFFNNTNYVVHRFTASGTLAPTTPTQLLNLPANTVIFYSSGTWTAPVGATLIQYLVVAGGGGGGGVNFSNGKGSGGGGAGAFRTASSVAVTAGAVYTVTVGAGGAGSTTPTNGLNSVII